MFLRQQQLKQDQDHLDLKVRLSRALKVNFLDCCQCPLATDAEMVASVLTNQSAMTVKVVLQGLSWTQE
jgi:hypothetical protein